MKTASRNMSAVFRLSPGSISWDCRGYRDGDPPSSGVSGTTPGISRTRFPYNASIWRTVRPRNASLEAHNPKIIKSYLEGYRMKRVKMRYEVVRDMKNKSFHAPGTIDAFYLSY
jgi:hypothetical protein